MDSKAEDYTLFCSLKDTYDIQLLTAMRSNKIKLLERKQMWRELHTERHLVSRMPADL